MNTALDAMIFHISKLDTIALALKDSTDYSHTSHAGYIADDIVKKDVHLNQSFLDMLYMSRDNSNQIISVTQVSAKHRYIIFGTECAGQQSISVELLQPLAIDYIGLSARYILDLSSINQLHFKASFFKYLKQWNPIYSSRFHSYGLNTAFFEPISYLVQIRREGFKSPNRWVCSLFRYCDIMLVSSNIYSSRIQIDSLQDSCLLALSS